jgi:hypothetical protein
LLQDLCNHRFWEVASTTTLHRGITKRCVDSAARPGATGVGLEPLWLAPDSVFPLAAARDARKAGRPTGRINGPFRSLAGSGTTAVAPGVGLRDAGLPARGRQHERLEERKQKLKAGQQRCYQQNLRQRQRQVKELLEALLPSPQDFSLQAGPVRRGSGPGGFIFKQWDEPSPVTRALRFLPGRALSYMWHEAV